MIKTQFTFAFILAFINVTNCLVLGQVQFSLNNLIVSESQRPPVTGRPERDTGGGTRGSCEDTTGLLFTPLLPLPASDYSASTITGYPTFWFYVPYSNQSVSYGTFSLEDSEGNRIYKLDFKLHENPGIVSVQLPKEEKPLEVNKTYYWYFRLYCSSEKSSEPNMVFRKGSVQRVAQEKLDAQLQTAKIENRAPIYIANQLWYDMPDLAQIRSRPNDWMNILKTLELEELKEENIIGPVLPR
ncbi:DUF928 domain-containing protein [Kamptonema sp. UHCC 0994]|uniref:DUF928 domain-containing protein n=1 Tax=Kamptonema sp. UHCC 0994 TaxID=3031329 RepID=UPI0023B9C7A8|nr:DUF928 domain-containing protein [Kamptonema sp. UHCC 0994]MDF0553635.1 DUF928 domain-containing protein [Kamptonema sp. UHCC 0994]